VVAVLSVLTIFFLLSIKRREGLEKELLRKQKLSAIGEMSAVLAHEIRNPMGSIKGCAQYLRELNARKGLAGQIQGYLDVMVSESLRLERLTEDLLCYAREYTIEQETFNLYDLVSEVVSSLTIPRSVSVNNLVREGLMLTSDKGKVRQVAINLLQNALDALQAEGSVTLRGEEVDGDVLLTVEDSGAGMNDETKAGIFRPFYTTKSKGTGLGLAIVDRYVAALGGKIEFESAVGRGSTFNVRIPARPDGKSRGRHA
jgi:two-component system sensor histidine kinase HydH